MSDIKAAADWFPITLDTTRYFRALYVGVAGHISVTSAAGTTQVFKNAAIGYHPLSGVKVNTSGTAATNIVGLL